MRVVFAPFTVPGFPDRRDVTGPDIIAGLATTVLGRCVVPVHPLSHRFRYRVTLL